ncbi:transcriptional regulator family: Fungal Specific TF [Aspergillus niger]|nr:transcriptional regulator family: Fungal Specific TF [Aspergillus niger]
MGQDDTPRTDSVEKNAGCARCKQRRIKCDETKPSCVACSRRGYDCPGYRRDVKWSSKHEAKGLNSESLSPSKKEPPMSWFTEPAEKLRLALLSDLRPPLDRSQPSTKRVEQCRTSSRCDGRTDTPDHSTTNSDSALTLQTSDAETTPERQHNAKLTSSPTDSSTNLRAYYFSHTCRLLSGYDSPTNPLREWVARLSNEHPVIESCIFSISAAHLSQQQREMTMLAASHHTAALASLSAGIEALDKRRLSHPHDNAGFVLKNSESMTALLLGIIMIGKTSSWNNPSSLGLQHLEAARTIFQSLYCESHSQSPSISGAPASDPRLARDFFVGALVYWEALTSFVVDNRTDAADYLLRFCDDENSVASVHPWSGVSPRLFISMSKIGSLARQAHHLRRASASPQRIQKDRRELLSQGKHLEELVCQYDSPPQGQFLSTGDPSTPVDDFQFLGYAYALSIMLELCRTFPELLRPDQRTPDYDTQRKHLNTLAITILTLIAKIPETSGTRAIQMPVLVIAGSTLQFQRIEDMDVDMEVFSDGASDPTHAPERVDIQFWRLFVDSRLDKMASYMGLDTVHRACRIVRETWARADQLLTNSSFHGQAPIVHWIDVMIDNGLETLIG